MSLSSVPHPPMGSMEQRVQYRLENTSSRFVMPSRFPPTSLPVSARRRQLRGGSASPRGEVTEHRFIHSPRAMGGVTVIGKGSVGLGADAASALASSTEAKMRDWASTKQRQQDADRARMAQKRREEEEASSARRTRFTPSRNHSPTRPSDVREMNMVPAMALSSSPQRVREFLRRQEAADTTRKEQAAWAARRKDEAEAQRAYVRTMHGRGPEEVRPVSPPQKTRCSSPPAEYVAKERSELIEMKASWQQEARERKDAEFQSLLQRHHDVAEGHYNVFKSREQDHQRRAECVRILQSNKLARDESRHELTAGHKDVIKKMKKRNVEENTDRKQKARDDRDAAVLRLVNGERIDSQQRLGTLAEREAQRSAVVHGMVQRVRPTTVVPPATEIISEEQRPSTADQLPAI